MKIKIITLLHLVSLLSLTGSALAAEERGPSVVVSIKPIHSLVAAIMKGAGEPRLLIQGGSSPHSYALRPSDARAIADAQLVVWVGEDLETFLEKPLASLGKDAVNLRLAHALQEHLLPLREGGTWEKHGKSCHEEEHAHEGGHDRDPHFWLDPEQATRAVTFLVAALEEIDPAQGDRYRENGNMLKQRLAHLSDELDSALDPVKNTPYVVFHDGYQYFEHAFSLHAVGSITLSPERKPGARRVIEIRQKLQDLQARCVFSEPQVQPALVATVIEGTEAKTDVLDPLGADLPPGPEAYFQIMTRMADALVRCLR